VRGRRRQTSTIRQGAGRRRRREGTRLTKCGCVGWVGASKPHVRDGALETRPGISRCPWFDAFIAPEWTTPGTAFSRSQMTGEWFFRGILWQNEPEQTWFAALREVLRPRKPYLFEKYLGERTADAPAVVASEKKAIFGLAVDAITTGSASAAALPHEPSSPTDDHLAKSVYPDIVVPSARSPTTLLARRRRSQQPQPPEARPAQAARADRSAVVVRPTHRGLSWCWEKASCSDAISAG